MTTALSIIVGWLALDIIFIILWIWVHREKQDTKGGKLMAATWTCDLCGTALKPVFPELNRRYNDCQFEDCLHIVLGGGYGEFVDGSMKLDLCKSCAETFLLQNERIADKLDEVEPDFGCAVDCECQK